jgi:DNA-binding protein H-NS
MTTKSYAQVQQQIEKLKADAEILRQGAIREVNESIKAYGLTIADLKFGANGAGTGRAPTKKAPAKSSVQAMRFSDGHGNEWPGRGPRPQWLRDALAAGQKIESFRVGAATKAAPTAAAPAAASKAAPGKALGAASSKGKRPITPKYRDAATGSTWSGRGSEPKWVRAAMAAGKTLSDFAIAGAEAVKPAVAPKSKPTATSKATSAKKLAAAKKSKAKGDGAKKRAPAKAS